MEAEKLNNELEEISEDQEIEVIPEENEEIIEENGEIDEKKENARQTFPLEDTEDRIYLKNYLTQLFYDISISLKAAKVKEKEEKKPKKPKKIMSHNATVKTLNLKFYAEQLMFGFMSDEELRNYSDRLLKNHQFHSSQKKYGEKTLAQSENNEFTFLFDRFKELVNSFSKDFQVIGIIHDKDETADPEDYFLLSSIKSHCHLMLRRTDKKPFRINKVLDSLGICYRRYIDNELWGYSVSTCKNWQASVAYLTHETTQAMADGKNIYDREEIFSNCETSLIDDFREGYNVSAEHIRVTQGELEIYDRLFYQKGYDLEDFDKLYDSLDFRIRSHCKMKTIRESYQRGVKERLKVDPPEVVRTCIFIEGPPNTGKTYSITKAARELFSNVFSISGGGSGKFDDMPSSTDAIIIDDCVCSNLLNMTDDKVASVYKRYSGNPIFKGELFIVTSNVSLYDWCEQCGLRVKNVGYSGTLNKHGDAMRTRFLEFVVQDMGDHNQIMISGGIDHMRGDPDKKQQKLDLANKLISRANEIMAEYVQSEETELKFDYKLFLKDNEEMITYSEYKEFLRKRREKAEKLKKEKLQKERFKEFKSKLLTDLKYMSEPFEKQENQYEYWESIGSPLKYTLDDWENSDFRIRWWAENRLDDFSNFLAYLDSQHIFKH